MATTLGDARIKVILDVEEAKRQLKVLVTAANLEQQRTDWHGQADQRHSDTDRGQQTTKNAPLRLGFRAAKALVYGRPFQAGQELLSIGSQVAGKALGVATTVALAKLVIDGLRESPKFIEMLKGLVPELMNHPLLKHLSDTTKNLADKVDEVFVKLSAIIPSEEHTRALGAATLRLGGQISPRGVKDAFEIVYNINQKQMAVERRVDREISREVWHMVGEAARQAVSR